MGGYRGPPEDDHGGSLASTRSVAARPVRRDPRHGRRARRRPGPRRRDRGVDDQDEGRSPLAAGHPGRRAPHLARRGARRGRHRARPSHVGEARARRLAGRQRSRGRGLSAHGGGAPRPADRLRSGDRRRRVRFPSLEPRASRHPARAAAERYVAGPRPARGRASRGRAVRPRDRGPALGQRGPVPADRGPRTTEGGCNGTGQPPMGIITPRKPPPANQATGNVRIVNGVVQTGLNVARYDDGTTIADKPLRMRGTVTDALITGGSAVLAVDAESRTFVNVLDVATATVRLKKDVKIKGQLAYAELTPAGLLYISRPDPATNAAVNVLDLGTGGQKFKEASESGKPCGGKP